MQASQSVSKQKASVEYNFFMIIIISIKKEESSAPLLLEISSGVKYLTNSLLGVDKQAASVVKQHSRAEAGSRPG